MSHPALPTSAPSVLSSDAQVGSGGWETEGYHAIMYL